MKDTRVFGLCLLSLILSALTSFTAWCIASAMVGDYEWDETPRFFGHHLSFLCLIALLWPTTSVAFAFIQRRNRLTRCLVVLLTYLSIVLGFSNARYFALCRSPEAVEDGEHDNGYNRDRYFNTPPHWAIDVSDRAHRSLKFMAGQPEEVAVAAFTASVAGISPFFRDASPNEAVPLRVIGSLESIFSFALLVLVIRLLVPVPSSDEDSRQQSAAGSSGPD